jgi:hypothetical protein
MQGPSIAEDGGIPGLRELVAFFYQTSFNSGFTAGVGPRRMGDSRDGCSLCAWVKSVASQFLTESDKLF